MMEINRNDCKIQKCVYYKLNTGDERKLQEWILTTTRSGKMVSQSDVTSEAGLILAFRFGKDAELSTGWFAGFLDRHPCLKCRGTIMSERRHRPKLNRFDEVQGDVCEDLLNPKQKFLVKGATFTSLDIFF